jgi:hypothetical protein
VKEKNPMSTTLFETLTATSFLGGYLVSLFIPLVMEFLGFGLRVGCWAFNEVGGAVKGCLEGWETRCAC